MSSAKPVQAGPASRPSRSAKPSFVTFIVFQPECASTKQCQLFGAFHVCKKLPGPAPPSVLRHHASLPEGSVAVMVADYNPDVGGENKLFRKTPSRPAILGRKRKKRRQSAFSISGGVCHRLPGRKGIFRDEKLGSWAVRPVLSCQAKTPIPNAHSHFT